jgi:cytochrome c
MDRDMVALSSFRTRVACAIALLLAVSGESVAGDLAYGQYLSAECVTCHQLSGKIDGIPSIIGWPDESFISVLNAYRKKERPHEAMQAIAGRLSDHDVAALAAYFSSVNK